jgi:Mn-dependent DtxR family transcriptional regulator
MSNIEVNDASHWREFENNPLSHSMAHYLMAIDSLRAELGYARSTDVADMLEVSRGAASMALSQLKKRGWVAEDPNRFLLLTDEGRRITRAVEHNFLILSRFFEHTLGVSNDTALGDACKMEHLMSRDTAKRLLWLFKHLVEDKTLAKKVGAIMEGYSDKWEADKVLAELAEQLEPSESAKN